jgi:hypothetical protein
MSCLQGQIKGWASWAAVRNANLWVAPERNWNKSEIWCHLTQVSTRDSLHNWWNVNVNTKSVSSNPLKCWTNIYRISVSRGAKLACLECPHVSVWPWMSFKQSFHCSFHIVNPYWPCITAYVQGSCHGSIPLNH